MRSSFTQNPQQSEERIKKDNETPTIIDETKDDDDDDEDDEGICARTRSKRKIVGALNANAINQMDEGSD